MRNFKPDDFKGSGQYLVRDTNTIDTSYLASVLFKVGYSHGHTEEGRNPNSNSTLLISMADGWTQNGHFKGSDPKQVFVEWKSIKDLCDHLNDRNTQEMRFATHEEIVRVALYQKARCK